MGSQTLVLRVAMDPETEDVVRDFGRELARWEQRVFGRWYADFRQHRSDLSRSRYEGLLSTKWRSARALGRDGGRESYRVNVQGRGHNLYNLFITKGKRVEPAVPTRIRASHLLGPLSHLGTSMENFLDRELRRQRCHDRRVRRRRREARARRLGSEPGRWAPSNFLPRFRPIARFQHGLVLWESTPSGPTYFEVSHPFEARKRLRVGLVTSTDPRFIERMSGLRELLAQGMKVGVELKQHDDGSLREGWYAHIAVPRPELPVAASVNCVMGVDVGERNPATLVVLNGPGAAADRVGPPKLYSGIAARDALERESYRVRRLRREADRLGSSGARKALDNARGKQRRILTTLAHQVSHNVVQQAVSRGATAIAMEDLTRFVPGERVRHPRMRFFGRRARRQRRLLSRWNRGEVQGFIHYKAVAAGIRLAGRSGSGVFARGTSSTCPRCGTFDRAARDRSLHRFACRSSGCGYQDNDDVVGASNIAARGWKYFHSDRSSVPVVPSARPLPASNPSPESGRVSTGIDPGGSSDSAGGAPSVPQATVGGQTGWALRPPANAENGMGGAVPQGNRPSPTAGGGRGISETTTSRSDTGGALPSDRPGGGGHASGPEVRPAPDTARNHHLREKSNRRRHRKTPDGRGRTGVLAK